MHTPKGAYFRPGYVKIEEIDTVIVKQKRDYAGIDTILSKCDIKSAFKLVGIRPDGVVLFSTEFDG